MRIKTKRWLNIIFRSLRFPTENSQHKQSVSKAKRENKILRLTVLCLPLFSRLLNNTLPGTFRQEGLSFAWNISGGKEPTALIGCGTSIPKPPQKTNAFRKPLLRNFSLYINFVFDLFFFSSPHSIFSLLLYPFGKYKMLISRCRKCSGGQIFPLFYLPSALKDSMSSGESAQLNSSPRESRFEFIVFLLVFHVDIVPKFLL